MNFLVKPKNLNYIVKLYNKTGEVVKELSGSDALTSLGAIEKSVNVDFITTVSSGELSLVSDSVYPDIAFNEFRLSVTRERSFIIPGYEPEAYLREIFAGEVTLPYKKDANSKISMSVRSFLISKNLDADINLGTATASGHVQALLALFDGITVDTASFTALGTTPTITLFLEKDWFATFNEVITGLCWVGKFAVYFDGKTARAVQLVGEPTEVLAIEPSQILLDGFSLSTKAETEVVTRLDLTDTFSGRVNWYDNVDRFGDNIQNIKLPYAGLFTAPVTDAANFWLNRQANLWLRLEMRLPFSYLELEPYKVVALSDLGRWMPNLNIQPVERYYFISDLPCEFAFTNSVRTAFKNGGTIWLKMLVPANFDPGDNCCILNLGNGSGLWYSPDDNSIYLDIYGDTTEPDSRYTFVADVLLPRDEVFTVKVTWDEENPTVAAIFEINDVVESTIDTVGTEPSVYEVGDGSFVGRSEWEGDLDWPAPEGFIFDILFYNASEELSLFISMKDEDHGLFYGPKDLYEVPGYEDTGIDEALGQVQRLTINLDGTLTALVETDIDATSGNRDTTYWTGPNNPSGIRLIGQTINETGMATLTWKPLVTGFTKYELAVDKDGATFYTNDNIVNNSAIVSFDVQLTIEESHTYTWKVRGFTP